MELMLDSQRTDVRLEIASNWWARMRGLLGRAQLDERQALLISPCNSVHTFGMRFPIDVAYLDASQKVLKVVAELPANRVSSCWGARDVMEFSSGTLKRLNIHQGVRLTMSQVATGIAL
jgi:uncharacterized protein